MIFARRFTFHTAKRVQDAEIANEQYKNRERTHYCDNDGCLVLKACIPAKQGALIVKALEMAMDYAGERMDWQMAVSALF